MSARGLAIGLAIPAAGALAATGVPCAAAPVASDRVTVSPGQLYSSAVVANGFVFTAGALGIDPETGELAGDDITSQTEQVLANLVATLTEAGSSMDRVVKATCFIASLDDFPAFNDVYRQAFPSEPPARTTVEVAGLPAGALVEIDLVAVM
jgi:2-iminobutanoate/2-iminopropanoate deaminase